MAKELGISIQLQFSKGNVKVDTKTLMPPIEHTTWFTVTGESAGYEVQTIGETSELVTEPADLGTLGYTVLWNLDADHYVDLGDDATRLTAGTTIGRLHEGQFCLFNFEGAAVYAKAESGATSCQLAKIMIEV